MTVYGSWGLRVDDSESSGGLGGSFVFIMNPCCP